VAAKVRWRSAACRQMAVTKQYEAAHYRKRTACGTRVQLSLIRLRQDAPEAVRCSSRLAAMLFMASNGCSPLPAAAWLGWMEPK